MSARSSFYQTINLHVYVHLCMGKVWTRSRLSVTSLLLYEMKKYENHCFQESSLSVSPDWIYSARCSVLVFYRSPVRHGWICTLTCLDVRHLILAAIHTVQMTQY